MIAFAGTNTEVQLICGHCKLGYQRNPWKPDLQLCHKCLREFLTIDPQAKPFAFEPKRPKFSIRQG